MPRAFARVVLARALAAARAPVARAARRLAVARPPCAAKSTAAAAASGRGDVRVGDEVSVECVDFATSGEGVCKLANGMVLLCDGATPGEVVRARVTKLRKKLAYGAKTATERAAPNAVTAPCPHYEQCGGCAWQHVNYDAQVRHKRNRVVDVLARIYKAGEDAEAKVGACVGADETSRYRNKMEFAFASGTRGKTVVGLRPRGANDSVVDLSGGCLLQSEEADRVLAAIRETLERADGRLEAFDRTSGEGTLRSVTIRTAGGERGGEKAVMVDLATTASPNELKTGPLAGLIDVVSKVPGVVSVVHTSVPSEAELRRAGGGRSSKFVKGGTTTKAGSTKKVEAVFGENKLVETLNGIDFELSSASFFQTNTEQAARLVRQVREACAFSGDKSEIVLDLFCGVGTMGLSVASDCSRVMGWEVVPEAVKDAKRNAELNNITNAKFYRVDLARLNPSKGPKGLLTTPKGKELPMPDIVITDPARPGMDSALIAILRTIGARRIVYVSCNPATQARDLLLLTAPSEGADDVAYELKTVTPVDMFPHTTHVESVAVLERKA